MKVLIVAFGILISATTFADTYISQVNTSSCLSWSFIRVDNGSSGYGCFSYPQNVYVADARSTQNAVTTLERRIEALEAKLNAIEAATQN